MGARKHEGPHRLFKDRIKARLELFLFDLILLYVKIFCLKNIILFSIFLFSKDRTERWFRFKFLKVLVYFGYMSKETGDMIEQFQ